MSPVRPHVLIFLCTIAPPISPPPPFPPILCSQCISDAGGQCCLLRFCMDFRPPVLLVPFPGFGARRVAPAVDNGTALSWWGWQWDNGILLVPVKVQDS
eukprot:4819714-Ditylum_brightwellii.AAC.1